MATLMELRQQRAARVQEMRGLCDVAERETRDLNQQEQGRFDVLKGEVSNLEAQIGRAETVADMERRMEGEPIAGHGGMAELEARYSVGKAIGEFLENGRLTGAEGEYAREHRSGRQGAIAVPASALLGNERRYVGTQTPAGGPAGALIATNLGPLIDRPRPALKVQSLGATVLSGLSSNLDLPRLKSSGTVGWVGEHQEGPQADPTFDKISIEPHTVTGNYEMSRRMLIQAPQIETVLRNDLGWLLAQALDLMAVRGTGSGAAPAGIKGTAGVPKLTFGTEKSAQDWINLTASMIGAIDAANIEGGTGYLTSPQVRAVASKLLTQDGMPLGVSTIFNQERVEFTTQIPSNLGAGTNLSEIYYGSWSQLIVAYFSSVDIVLNPYADSIAKKGGAYLHAFLDADVAIRHPEAFVYADDVPTTLA
ncbi:phage major capsid protein [Methylobacterium isbiliense]|uniref:Phage capsid-like C-terminal domain-containing protein n=1 Tax=Methylobacterium isbiliense TaxID=315478 RepID=A0ABQ4SCS3_9HYPH|nr:phage major capsid protein [Methylobacterium isbiliense]MDN3622007.1 phage major capsid protein [Methylobacterium isbiliense]GJD99480.1 hypothetical protein GMJLKIPL_1398 [Methylobacterium isbiliense]